MKNKKKKTDIPHLRVVGIGVACMRVLCVEGGGSAGVTVRHKKKDIPHLRAARVHMHVRVCVVLC